MSEPTTPRAGSLVAKETMSSGLRRSHVLISSGRRFPSDERRGEKTGFGAQGPSGSTADRPALEGLISFRSTRVVRFGDASAAMVQYVNLWRNSSGYYARTTLVIERLDGRLGMTHMQIADEAGPHLRSFSRALRGARERLANGTGTVEAQDALQSIYVHSNRKSG